MLLQIAQVSEASCVPAGCYAVDVVSTSCKGPFTSASIPLGGPLEGFVELGFRVAAVRPVPCAPGQEALTEVEGDSRHVERMNRAYYYTGVMGRCEWFLQNPATFFFAPVCCDMPSLAKQCGPDAPVLRDLPPQAAR
jgi:hypothetical protein